MLNIKEKAEQIVAKLRADDKLLEKFQANPAAVIEEYIRQRGQDYRYETAPNPVPPLRDRSRDDTQVGRLPEQVLERV